MPAPGDQHKSNGTSTTNPFEESKPHISEYTAQEIATLQSRLNKRLGPEFISTRPGPGNQKVAYLSAEKAINLANEVFGFNGWSSSIQNIQIDFVDENPQNGKVSLGLSVVVRVTLKDGTYHEDIGYGGIENCKGKAMAFEKSKKEATTDALKRALRSFGNVLGNCMYDRDYITKVSKVKAGNGRFDPNELHRHPDYAPKVNGDVQISAPAAPTANIPPSLEFEDSFDVSEFDDIDFNDNDLSHPDEVLLPGEAASNRTRPTARYDASTATTPSKPPQSRPSGPPQTVHPRPTGQPPGKLNETASRPLSHTDANHFSSPGMGFDNLLQQQGQLAASTGASMAPPTGFYSAKAAKDVDPNNLGHVPSNAVRFNPHAESPSIRKTAGIDHTKSVPVRREIQKPDINAPPNIVDPRGDLNRRIGMPGAPAPGVPGRPGMSTSAYRPPTRHGSPAVSTAASMAMAQSIPADRVLTAVQRPPLGDLSNVQRNVTAVTTEGLDAKRQRLGVGESISPGAENIVRSNVDPS